MRIFFLKQNMCKGDLVLIISDSQLLVRQLKGEYKVKKPQLKSMHKCAKDLLKNISYNIVHVLREENEQADEQANFGVDKKIKLPKQFLSFLQDYDIPV